MLTPASCPVLLEVQNGDAASPHQCCFSAKLPMESLRIAASEGSDSRRKGMLAAYFSVCNAELLLRASARCLAPSAPSHFPTGKEEHRALAAGEEARDEGTRACGSVLQLLKERMLRNVCGARASHGTTHTHRAVRTAEHTRQRALTVVEGHAAAYRTFATRIGSRTTSLFLAPICALVVKARSRRRQETSSSRFSIATLAHVNPRLEWTARWYSRASQPWCD